MEFAREQKLWFDRWINSKKVSDDYKKLEELILIEQFKNSVSVEIQTYLDEREVDTIEKASRAADNYATTHKVYPRKTTASYYNKNVHKAGNENQNPRTVNSSSSVKLNCKSSMSDNDEWRMKNLKCHFCGEAGHIRPKCTKYLTQTKAGGVNPKPNFKDTKSVSFINVSMSEKEQNIVPNLTVKVKDEKPNLNTSSKQCLFDPFTIVGTVSSPITETKGKPVKILRDTGAAQSCLLEGVLPREECDYTGENVLLKVIGCFVEAPLCRVKLQSMMITDEVVVAIVPDIPTPGVEMLLANDLCGDKVLGNPVVCKVPKVEEATEQLEVDFPGIFPACAVTRSMGNNEESSENVGVYEPNLGLDELYELGNDESEVNDGPQKDDNVDNDLTITKVVDVCSGVRDLKITREKLIEEQKMDDSLKDIRMNVVDEEKSANLASCFYLEKGILMRKWRPLTTPTYDTFSETHQIVVPIRFRSHIMQLAHDSPMAGHLGVNKTYRKVAKHFFWPKSRKDIADYCRTCPECQQVGKSAHTPKVAPLNPIPAFGEPFSRLIIDCVGPLPKTKKGNLYLFTIMCASTRFPEAIPLHSIKSKQIVQAFKKFISFVGIPIEIQSDQGSNFMSQTFKKCLDELKIDHVTSTAYHPQSQGALERFHQTFKNMLRIYAGENPQEWDEWVPMLLFAIRDAVQESLGFTPFEMVFGHTVRGPLKLLKDCWLDETTKVDLLDHIYSLKDKVAGAWRLARQNLEVSQCKMKEQYDKESEIRSFEAGDEVLVLMPTPGQPLNARYFGPYKVVRKINEVNYMINIPEGRKKYKICHLNLLKKFHSRLTNAAVNVIARDATQPYVSDDYCKYEGAPQHDLSKRCGEVKLKNSDALRQLHDKVSDLTVAHQNEIISLIGQFTDLFSDTPKRCNNAIHHVNVGTSSPVKQHPYRLSPEKRKYLKDEIEYLLLHDIIEPSSSDWASPCLLVDKPDNSYRMVTDYRKVNSVTVTDCYPLPRIDDIIDKVGTAKFVTKIDLLKGYYQIPLSEEAKVISAFTVPSGLYQYKVMPFGMKNAPATFQRMINKVIADIEGVEAYVDDIVVCGDTWEEHINKLRIVFERLHECNLTINLLKSEFGKAEVVFLGHVVGGGKVAPISAKIEAICEFPVPKDKKGIMRFLGMAGYYRRFCRKFSDLAAPLTNLLRKNCEFKWNDLCQNSFQKIKSFLTNHPVLKAPNFKSPFVLHVDASELGAGAVLLQEVKGVLHPVSYFSKKFDKFQKNYSIIEKETLSLILSLQHFEVYCEPCVCPLVVYTDHNPLLFINKMKNKNQRLMRWSLFLQPYQLEIRHISGKDNVLADTLSRNFK